MPAAAAAKLACTPTPLIPVPRILIVVPGHGEPKRSHVTLANLARIERMRVHITCMMFVFGTKLTPELAASRFPQCSIKRQDGYWMHHLRQVPEADVHRHDFVLLMIDGVEMNADVDLQMLSHIMQQNCLSVSGPACGSCKSKQLIHPMPGVAVGRRVQYIDPQVTMYTPNAFLCLQRLIDVIGLENDPSGWSISQLLTNFCNNRVGIVDAMSVEKIYSKSYDCAWHIYIHIQSHVGLPACTACERRCCSAANTAPPAAAQDSSSLRIPSTF